MFDYCCEVAGCLATENKRHTPTDPVSTHLECGAATKHGCGVTEEQTKQITGFQQMRVYRCIFDEHGRSN